jgi:outer membrane protein assembly factor BamB
MTSVTVAEDRANVSRGGLPWIRRWPRLHRSLNRAFAGMLVLFALGLVWMWVLSPHPMGLSIPYMVTSGMAVVTPIVAVFWLVLCSRFPRKLVWTVTSIAAAGMAGFVACIRDVEFSGDMRPMLEWRWEPTSDELLEKYLATGSRDPASLHETPPIEITPEDMPVYRGVNRDGQIVGPPLNEDWSTSPPQTLWKHPVGGGYAQPVVVGDLLVTIEQRQGEPAASGGVEAVVCYDAATGNERWKHSWPANFDEAMGGPGPRATPTIAGGRIYALGAEGHLECLELASGKVVWARDLLKDFDLVNSNWGMTSAPLVLADRVVVNIGGHYGGGLVALRLDDGKDIWKSEGIGATKDHPPALVAAALKASKALPPPGDGDHAPPASADGRRNLAGYAAPVIVSIDGIEQVLNFDGIGLWGHALDDGRALWFHHFENGPGVNVAQPIVFSDGRILISASYGFGSRMLKISRIEAGWQVDVLWGSAEKPNREMKSKMSSPVLVDGYLYGLDEGFLTCLDPANGDRKWKKSRQAQYGHGQLLVTNGKILVFSERGELALIDPKPSGLIELGRFPVLEGVKNWNPPALVRGKAYVRNHHEMACVELCRD